LWVRVKSLQMRSGMGKISQILMGVGQGGSNFLGQGKILPVQARRTPIGYEQTHS